MDLPGRLSARSTRALAWAALFFAPAAAVASQILVNGVPIGSVQLRVQGLEDFTFEKCNTVKVERNGDIKIDCPGYDLKAALPGQAQQSQATTAVAPAPPAAELGHVSKRYWVVASQTEPGATQYDIDLYVNKKWVHRFRSSDGTAVIEISKQLAPGANSIIFAATKAAEPRKSTSATALYKFIVGEGDIAGSNLKLDKVEIQYQKSAADTDNSTDERSLTAG